MQAEQNSFKGKEMGASPLQYPDIITRVGESLGLADHKSKPAEFSLTHRFTADSAEIDYIKKNDEYLNDFDSDKEISEEERLHFPVWRGPDYEENDIKNYLISNMIFNQEDCANLDQTQFIPKDSKAFIKVYNKDNHRKEGDEVEVEVDGKTEIVEAISSIGEYLKTKAFYVVKIKNIKEYENIYEDENGNQYIDLDKRVRVLSTEKKHEKIEHMLIKYDDKILNQNMSNPVYSLYSLYYGDDYIEDKPVQFALGSFFAVNKMIEKCGYAVTIDISPTKEEVKNYFEKTGTTEIFYFSGHGNIVNGIPQLNIFLDSSSVPNYDTGFIKFGYEITPEDFVSWGAKTDFCFLDACLVGKYLEDTTESNFTVLDYKAAVGWGGKPHSVATGAIDILALKKLKNGSNLGEAFEYDDEDVYQIIADNLELTPNQTSDPDGGNYLSYYPNAEAAKIDWESEVKNIKSKFKLILINESFELEKHGENNEE